MDRIQKSDLNKKKYYRYIILIIIGLIVAYFLYKSSYAYADRRIRKWSVKITHKPFSRIEALISIGRNDIEDIETLV